MINNKKNKYCCKSIEKSVFLIFCVIDNSKNILQLSYSIGNIIIYIKPWFMQK